MKYTAPSDFLPRRAPSGFSAGDPGKSSLEVRCPEVDGLGKGSCVVEPARGGCSPVPDSPTLTYSRPRENRQEQQCWKEINTQVRESRASHTPSPGSGAEQRPESGVREGSRLSCRCVGHLLTSPDRIVTSLQARIIVSFTFTSPVTFSTHSFHIRQIN